MQIVNHFCSWSTASSTYELEYEDNLDWNLWDAITGSYPLKYTVFNEKLYITPVTQSGLVITFWAIQEKVINKMDENTDPEIKEDLDETLILGIMAKINPEFIDAYELELKRRKGKFGLKVSDPGHIKGIW